MDRVQRALGYLGTLLLLAGLAITAVGPTEFGIADEGGPGSDAATGTDAPVAAASVPDGTNDSSDGTASDADATPDDGLNRTSPSTDDGTDEADGG